MFQKRLPAGRQARLETISKWQNFQFSRTKNQWSSNEPIFND